MIAMKDLKGVVLWASVVCICNAIPIFQPQLGIVASNSNEILRLGGVTLTGIGGQGTAFMNPFLQPNVIMPPQVMSFNPQFPGPFLPQQQGTPGLLPNQVNQGLPYPYAPAQQELPTGPVDPNTQQLPQIPGQFVPQYYPSMPYPQGPGGQYPYYPYYGYPQRNTAVAVQPNPNNNQQNIERTTLKPQLPIQNPGKGGDVVKATPAPDNRGDLPGPVIEEGYPRFSFLP
ncbi:calcium-binding protein P [Engraulis encrasicolus]|uniref:calcium-binding protein P n=1 Tax=Engraulis encrasicolus TaxID=184585 RepID=UPI002FD65C85